MTPLELNPDGDEKFTKTVYDFAEKIGERCFSIRIIAVVPAADGATQIYTIGNGDWYSQIGAVREWLRREDEKTRCEARKEADSDEP